MFAVLFTGFFEFFFRFLGITVGIESFEKTGRILHQGRKLGY